jgi:hypothetical protein
MAMKPAWTYGSSPAPHNWHEAAEAMKSIKQSKPRKSSGLLDRLAAIESLLKEKK